jgi:hypothetical protein
MDRYAALQHRMIAEHHRQADLSPRRTRDPYDSDNYPTA